jgi:hypothetical protein
MNLPLYSGVLAKSRILKRSHGGRDGENRRYIDYQFLWDVILRTGCLVSDFLREHNDGIFKGLKVHEECNTTNFYILTEIFL